MTDKFKTMTLIEEAELDRLPHRQIKDYNPALNSLTKIQHQIFKKFYEKELSDEGKCKIIAQFQEQIGFLLNKFKNAGPPHAQAVRRQPAPDEHVCAGPPAIVVQADTEDFFYPPESADAEEANALLTLSPARSLKDRTTSSNAAFLTIQPQPEFNYPTQEEAKFPRNIQRNLLTSLSFSMRIKPIFLVFLKSNSL